MSEKIAVGASSFDVNSPDALALIGNDYTFVKNPFGRKLTIPETIEHLQGCVGLLAGLETLNEEVFSKCPELKAVARIGVGTDNVDFDAAKKFNIKVSNTPDAPTYAVAEMALAALLTISRRIIPCSESLHRKEWKKQIGNSIRGSSVLLIGYGRIAREFERLLSVFNPKEIVFHDKYVDGSTPLSDALPNADIISLHASGKEQIIGGAELQLVKNGAVLLNSARGALVDETALAKALESGKVGFYWGDVFPEEPYSGALCNAPNTVLTPHVSTYTGLCRNEMERQAVENVLRDLK
jgi:D-3-phosphoglycerate dehydrogenase